MQLTPARVMPRRLAAGGRNPRPRKTTDEVRVKIPYILVYSDTHQKNWPEGGGREKNWPIKACSEHPEPETRRVAWLVQRMFADGAGAICYLLMPFAFALRSIVSLQLCSCSASQRQIAD